MPEPLAVVVPTRDRPVHLDRCLAALRTALRDGDELVVVDSASADPGPVAAAAARHAATLVRLEQAGSNRARNAGWRATSAPVVVFVDDDVTVEPGWADGYRDGIGAHGFATGWIGAPAGSRTKVAVKTDEGRVVLTRDTTGTLGHGASTAVRREALERVGGWDEQMGVGARFGASPEHDLYDRLLAAGYDGVYLPGARAVHDQWRSELQTARLHLRYALGSGARMAKLLRTDRRRLRWAVHQLVWDWGVWDVVRELRRGRVPHAAVAVLRLGGYAVGFALGLCSPVVDGHYAERRR